MKSVFVILGLLVCTGAAEMDDVWETVLPYNYSDWTFDYEDLDTFSPDPVSPVKLTVDSVTNSSDSCDLTVTCRSLDSHQISINTTVTCNTTTCSQEGGEELKFWFFSIYHVYLLNDMLICDHSNLVSWTNDSIMVGPSLCVPPPGPESLSAGVSLCLVKTVVFSVALIIMVAAVISVNVMERLKNKN